MLNNPDFYKDFGIQIDRMEMSDSGLILTASSTQLNANCPHCDTPSTRISGWYRRKPADLPCMGRFVQLHLRVRRFVCDNEACACRTFGERFPAFVLPYARRTARLTCQQQQVGFAVGGEAGARLLNHLGMPASPDTLLRQVRNAPEQEVDTPRILGVDDWAFRKGQYYGTILVDLEQQRPIDLLPDRSAESFATWLIAHPGVEVISRDRGADYAEGGKQGAPAALQVADRFHLLQNLTDALRRFFDRYPKHLREAARQAVTEEEVSENQATASLSTPELSLLSNGESEEPVGTDAVARPETATQGRFAEVKSLQQQGWSRRAVAEHLRLDRRIVGKYWSLDEAPQRQHGTQSISTVTPYLSYLVQRWQDGCQERTQLYTDLQAQGYTGSYQSVWRATNRLLKEGDLQQAGQQKPVPIPSFSARKAAWLFTTHTDDLEPHQQQLRSRLCQICPEAAAADQLAQSFCQMIRTRQVDVLDDWLQRAEQSIVPELQRFTAGLRRDYAAVRAALATSWSNGQVEGQVNRLKLIKRMMFGRAKFDLLRKRVLGYPVLT